MAPRRITVLHLLPTGSAGGVETFVLKVARGLDRERFALRACILRHDGPVADELRALGVDVTVLDLPQVPRWRAILPLLRALRGVDVVHANAGGQRLRRLAQRRGARVVSHVHGPPDEWVGRLRRRDPSLAPEIAETFVAHSNLLVAFSAYCRDLVRQHVPTPPPFRMLPYGLEIAPLPDVNTARRQRGIPESAHVLGFVGRLVEQKGILYLLESAGIVLARDPDALLVVVGDGPLRPDLESFAASHPGRIILAGEQPDAAAWMPAFDLLLLPSEWEPFGIVGIEAGAAALPVAGFRIDGIPEVVADGDTGILVPHRDSRALAEAAWALLSDPARRLRMGAAARGRAERDFRLDSMLRALEKLYVEVARGRALGAQK